MNIHKEQMLYKDMQELNELYEEGIVMLKTVGDYLDKIADMTTAKEAELREGRG